MNIPYKEILKNILYAIFTTACIGWIGNLILEDEVECQKILNDHRDTLSNPYSPEALF